MPFIVIIHCSFNHLNSIFANQINGVLPNFSRVVWVRLVLVITGWISKISWSWAINLKFMSVYIGQFVHKLLMIDWLSIVQSSWRISTNQSSSANLRCNSSLHALSLNHFKSLIFGHFKSSPWRHSRTNRRASHFWTHIWCHPVRTMNRRWVHRIWKEGRWTLWHATNLVLGLV